jgi:multidrug transporter EmrE-like cation transporter
MKFDISRLNNTDLTKIVYPITIFITGGYALMNLYTFVTGKRPTAPMLIIVAIAFALITVGFVYLALKKVRLKFKWSVLSVIGIILIVVFSREAMDIHRLDFFLTPGWDHTFFPIAFGFFFLCDLSKIPKKFWLFLLPFALLTFILGNAMLILNSIFDRNVFESINAPNYPFAFFGVNNWEEFHAIPKNSQFIGDFIQGFLHEFLTFFTLFPVVIIYHIVRKQKQH